MDGSSPSTNVCYVQMCHCLFFVQRPSSLKNWLLCVNNIRVYCTYFVINYL